MKILASSHFLLIEISPSFRDSFWEESFLTFYIFGGWNELMHIYKALRCLAHSKCSISLSASLVLFLLEEDHWEPELWRRGCHLGSWGPWLTYPIHSLSHRPASSGRKWVWGVAVALWPLMAATTRLPASATWSSEGMGQDSQNLSLAFLLPLLNRLIQNETKQNIIKQTHGGRQ